MGGRKDDEGKPRHSLLPFAGLEAVTRVLEYGASRYGDHNWREVDSARYVDAALRHLFAYCRGECYDKESGQPHLAHAATNLLFVLAIRAEEKKNG